MSLLHCCQTILQSTERKITFSMLVMTLYLLAISTISTLG